MNGRVQQKLAGLARGRAEASAFELLAALIFRRAFCPACIDRPLLRVSSPHPDYRRDIILPVTAVNGAWHYWSVVYGSDLLMVECKNYDEPVSAAEIDLSAKYLRRPGLASLAFLATRRSPSDQAVDAARDLFRTEKKLFIFLADDALMALAGYGGNADAATAFLRREYQQQKARI